jgi:hypothetical protein
MSEDVKPYGAGVAPSRPTPEKLRELLAQLGMSQRGAAKELGIDERTMRYWASGDTPIPPMAMYALRWLGSQDKTRANALVDLQTSAARGPHSAKSLAADGPGPQPEPHSARGVAKATARRTL